MELNSLEEVNGKIVQLYKDYENGKRGPAFELARENFFKEKAMLVAKTNPYNTKEGSKMVCGYF